MESVRYFILRRLLHNVILKADNIVDMDKNIADFLSRTQWRQFKMLKSFPAQIPTKFVNMMYRFKYTLC